MIELQPLLAQMLEHQASDLYVTVGAPCILRIDGQLIPSGIIVDEHSVRNLIEQAMDPERSASFYKEHEANFALVTKIGRFRVSAFLQREQPGMVLRRIETKIPNVKDLRLPEPLKDLILSKRGLILVIGATGSGKSTSMAALTGYRNKHTSGHILTIEDPIEFVHDHDKCIVTQREVGIDTDSFEVALKNSLRQAPDMILIGEIRNRETMEYAMTFAETGHLCMATLHANNANQALERILHLVPKEQKEQFLFDLSLNLRCILGQQLAKDIDGDGRHGVFELLINTARVSDLIRRGELNELKTTMARSNEQGMITFDQSLFSLFKEDKISEAEALHLADSPNDLRLMIKMSGNDNDNSSLSGAQLL